MRLEQILALTVKFISLINKFKIRCMLSLVGSEKYIFDYRLDRMVTSLFFFLFRPYHFTLRILCFALPSSRFSKQPVLHILLKRHSRIKSIPQQIRKKQEIVVFSASNVVSSGSCKCVL